MRRTKALAAALALGTTLALVPVPAIADGHAEDGAAAPSDEELAAKEALQVADIWLQKIQQRYNIPALSIAIAKGDNTIWSKGFGHTDRARSMPATGDTIYSICSISKLFTAVAFMQEWEKGRVRLDEPVSTYLPWATLAESDQESVPVTMRGLLTHSAGLPRESAHPYWTGPDFPFPTQAEIRNGMPGQSPLYPASTTFQYSNLGLTLVGEAVEAVSGQRYGDYVSTNILEPLGMSNTAPFIQSDKYGEQMAVGWGSLTEDGSRPAVKLFDARGINPAAGFSSTVNDLAKFASWQFKLARDGEAKVLRASTLREMQRVHYITPDRETAWGLGFATYELNGTNVVGHGGSCPGYRSTLMIDMDNEFAIAMAMNTMESPGWLARQVGGLFGARMGAEVFDAPESGEVDLSSYAGFYDAQPWSREFIIVPWAGGLAYADISYDEPGDVGRLKPLGEDRFRVITDSGMERDIVTFHRNADGSISHFERFGNFNRFSRPL
jgi:CubicO group peptidase (beta-lactamase class C family)